jgi:hypothetical protein
MSEFYWGQEEFNIVTDLNEIGNVGYAGRWFDIAYTIREKPEMLKVFGEYFASDEGKDLHTCGDYQGYKLPRVVMRALRVFDDYDTYGRLRQEALNVWLRYNARIPKGATNGQIYHEDQNRENKSKEMWRVRAVLKYQSPIRQGRDNK